MLVYFPLGLLGPSLPLPSQDVKLASAPSLVTSYVTATHSDSPVPVYRSFFLKPLLWSASRSQSSSALTDLPGVNPVSESQFTQDIPLYTRCPRVTLSNTPFHGPSIPM